MKIVLIGGCNIPGFGGVESYMMNLARELSNQGHKATIVCCSEKSYETTIDDVCVIHKACPKQSIFTFPTLFIKSIGYILKNRKNIDVVNLKCDQLLMGSVLNEQGVFPAYHMSKTHWISVALDGSVQEDKVKWLLDLSYDLTNKKIKKKKEEVK